MASRPVSSPTLSLRRHLLWILLVKIVVIACLRYTFFPSLEQQHQPADIYSNLPEDDVALRSRHD
ncbi:MAG: hypothetical protein MI808_17500 [Pseudomonadales bacterium]|nr:hypothetical protein [Pseudomonadales bacterium]